MVQDRMLTMAEIQRIFRGVPAGTLRRWASEDKWPKRRLTGITAYSATAASVSYSRRNRPRRETT